MKGPLGRILSLRRVYAVALIATCASVLVSQHACVLAASTGELQRLPDSRPTIKHSSLIPSSGAVLTRFPSVFIVPVELADPKVSFAYAAFIDYNPQTGNGLVELPRGSEYEPANTLGRTRILEVAIAEPLDLDRCHVIEVIVALRFFDDPRTAHNPPEPGGDIATWFYNPNGDLGGCPSLDAGIDARVDAEGGEGGPQ
jgi:hypothetical protein